MKKCVAVVAFAFLFVFSSASNAGLTFRMVTSVDGKTSNEMRSSVEGGLIKMEVVRGEQDNPFMPPGSYMLIRDDGMYLVNPHARTFARVDLSMATDAMRAVTDSGLGGAFTFSNVSMEKTIDEPGETIEGYPTRHYQFKSSWTMQMTGSPMTMSTSSVEDIWVTDQIAMPAQAGMAFDQSSLPQGVRELAEAQGERNVDGFPLRTITQQSTKTDMGVGGLGGRMAQRMMNRAMGSGGADDTTTTLEAVDIEQVDIPLDTFDIPADFSETQLFQTGSALPNLNSIQN